MTTRHEATGQFAAPHVHAAHAAQPDRPHLPDQASRAGNHAGTGAGTGTGTGAGTETKGWLPGLAALGAGVVFGLGLGIAGMIDPLKVLGFLDIAGAWDASLLFVLGGAVGVAALGFGLVLRRPMPRLGDRFHLSPRRDIDAPLLVGAALFGVGWGLVGYCPGPAIASIGFANPEALWFVPALLAGGALQRWQRHAAQRSAPVDGGAGGSSASPS